MWKKVMETVCGYDNYISDTCSWIFCYFDCLRNVLNYYRNGNIYSDIDIFLHFNGNNLDYKPGEYIGYDIFSSEKLALLKGVCSFCGKEEGAEQFEAHIIEAIQRQQPLICCVNSKGLLYNQIYTRNANQIHFILVIGVDTVTKRVAVHDVHMRLSGEKVIECRGEMGIGDLHNTLRYSQSISRDILDVMADRTPSIGEVLQKYLDSNDKKIAAYLEDAFNRISLLDTREAIKAGCLKLNYDLKISGPCYLLKYYCLLTGNALFGQLGSEWVKIGNELLVYGQRGKFDGNKMNALWEKAKALQEKQRTEISKYLSRQR